MADDLLDRIAKLEALNAELVRQIAELRIAIDRRGTGFHSMRDTRRCPACGSGSLLHVRRAQEAAYSHRGLMDKGIAHGFSAWTGSKSFGPMESFSCRSCGLVEYHVLDFRDVKIDGQQIVAIEPEPEPPSDGPFR